MPQWAWRQQLEAAGPQEKVWGAKLVCWDAREQIHHIYGSMRICSWSVWPPIISVTQVEGQTAVTQWKNILLLILQHQHHPCV